MWTQILTNVGCLLALAVASPSFAEGYGYNYGGGDPYAGVSNTGGYNLLDFSLNMYNASSYMTNQYGYDSSSYGGGCGSFYSTCSGGYGSAGLYGSNYGTSPYLYGSNSGSNYGSGISIDIDINILSGLQSSMGGGCGTSSYGSVSTCGGGYGGAGDIGCSIGYCSSGSTPYLSPGYPYYGNYGGGNTYGGGSYSPYNYGLPGYTSTIDINVQNPWQNYQPPVYTPPYNGCGLGSYPCPSGPVTRIDPPVYYPPNYYPPAYHPTTYPIPTRVEPPVHTPTSPVTPYYPPTYTPPTPPTVPTTNPVNQFIPTPPNRYQVPRG